MSQLIIRILWTVIVIIYLALGIYGLLLLKADWALGKKIEKESVHRLTILTATIGCIWTMGRYMLVYSGIINRDNRYVIGIFITGIIGHALIFYSIIRSTILSIQAMALAEGGIVATRKRWLILLGKYGVLVLFLMVCAVSIISRVISKAISSSLLSSSVSGTYSVTFIAVGFVFGYMSYTFQTLAAANQASTNPEQQGISNRCREIHRFTMKISICSFLIAIGFLTVIMITVVKNTGAEYFTLANNILLALVEYIIMRDLSLLTSRNDHNLMHQVPLITPLLKPTTSPKNRNDHTITPKVTHMTTVLKPATSPKPPTSALEVTGIVITNKDQHSIGMAPHAPRPSWLPTNGTGQANVEPNCWSISLENWVRFVHECMATATWSSLAETKGERSINMYDINVHFIKPWTSGTGCSIACLMNDNQGPVDLMVSHAWAGSVIESLASIKTIMTMYLVPKETRIFFDTVCLYQAEDGTTGGLSILEQLKKKPFQTIINKKPQRGMFIIHTTISEVYERLWCVHEVDEAIEAKIEIYGAFDPASWNAKALKSITTSFSTKSSICQGESDKEMLTNLVNCRGGFDRLDCIVRDVRQQSIKDLEAVNLFEQLFSMSISSVDTFNIFEV